MADAYIKLHRKMLEWEWYDDINTKVLFLHCLLRANWQAGSWHGIKYEAGQFITSLPSLAEETHLTVKQVRVALNHLKETGEVADFRQANCRIITVKNWGLYQCKGRLEGRPRADQGQTKGRPRASDKEYKEDEELKEGYVGQIVDYLNAVLGTKYTCSKHTTSLINARLAEKYTVEDFKTVIDKKSAQWKNDPKMATYLRPETLFAASHFESYLNEKVGKPKSAFGNFNQRQYDYEAMQKEFI